MRVVFVYGAYENLGIEYLSAVLKQHGYDTKLVFDPLLFNDHIVYVPLLDKLFSYRDKVVKQVIRLNPDVVCFSVISDDYGWACDLAKQIKNIVDVPIVFGGIHPTSVPEIVIRNKFVDFVVVGEGEYALLDIVMCLESGKPCNNIPNVWLKKDGKIIRNNVRKLVQNLDKLPFTDKDLFYRTVPLYFYTEYSIMTSRGCPYRCSYCNNSYLRDIYSGKGAYLRRRSVDNVIEELNERKDKYNIRYIHFDDEIFTYDIKWLEEFALRYRKEIDVPFFCWVHPVTINKKTVSLLKKAGCSEVEMGVQTINERVRRDVLNRFVSNRQIKDAIRLLNRENIWITTDNIFQIPGQSEDDIIELARFYNENRVDLIQVYWLRYYPKTKIVGIAKNFGIITEEDIHRLNQNQNSKSFCVGGDTFRRDIAKLHNLILLIHYLPKSAIDFIIEKKLYKFLPPWRTFAINLLINNLKGYVFWNSKKRRYLRKKFAYRYLAYIPRRFWIG